MMKIVDCFCGVGPWATKDPILPSAPEEILEIMDHTGTDQALVYHNTLKFNGWTLDANLKVAAICKQHPRFIPAFVIGLNTGPDQRVLDDDLEEMRQAGARALWLRLPFTPYRQTRSYQRWMIGDWLDACCRHRIPVFFHAQDESPDLIHSLCTEYPDLRLILTGMMYNSDEVLYPLLKLHRQLRVCTGHAYIPSGNPARFLKHFPADRLLFGSGLPEHSPGGMIAHINYADIPEPDKQKILGGNLMALIGEVCL